jgi:hypothetical protein
MKTICDLEDLKDHRIFVHPVFTRSSAPAGPCRSDAVHAIQMREIDVPALRGSRAGGVRSLRLDLPLWAFHVFMRH